MNIFVFDLFISQLILGTKSISVGGTSSSSSKNAPIVTVPDDDDEEEVVHK